MDDNTQMTSAPGASLIPDGTSVITTMHLVIMVIFAVLVVIGILWGMRLKRQRKAADREVAEDNAALRDDAKAEPHVAPVPTGTPNEAREDTSDRHPEKPPAGPSVAPTALAPAPPPMSDAPVVGHPPVAGEPVADGPSTAIPVTTLKGLGPKVAARLAELGLTDAAQLAALDDAGAAALDAELGAFAGRMARDRWIEQARLLVAGDRAGYEAAFGKLS